MNRRKFIGLTGSMFIGGLAYSSHKSKPVLAASETKIATPDAVQLDDGNTLNIPFKPFDIEGQNINDLDTDLTITYKILDNKNNELEKTEDTFVIEDENFTLTTNEKTLSVDGEKLFIRESNYRLQITISHTNVDITVNSDKFSIDNKYDSDLTQIYTAGLQKIDSTDGTVLDNASGAKDIIKSDVKHLYHNSNDDNIMLQKRRFSDLKSVSNYSGNGDYIESMWVSDNNHIYITIRNKRIEKIDTDGELSKVNEYSNSNITGGLWGDSEYIYAGGDEKVYKINKSDMTEEDTYNIENDNLYNSGSALTKIIHGINGFIYIGKEEENQVIKLNKDSFVKEDTYNNINLGLQNIFSHREYLYIADGEFDGDAYLHQIKPDTMEARYEVEIPYREHPYGGAGVGEHVYIGANNVSKRIHKYDVKNMNKYEDETGDVFYKKDDAEDNRNTFIIPK